MADRPADLSARFANNVRATREHRGLSQTQLAKRMADYGHQWVQNTIQRIEHQQRRVDIAEADALAHALQVTVEELLTGGREYITDAPTERIRLALNEFEDSEANLTLAQQRHIRAARQLADLFPAGLTAGEVQAAAETVLENRSDKSGG